jgi:hypothetical protein
MAESGQPLLPAPAWQAITQTTQPRDSQWQVAERRYLSETSMALVLANAAAQPHDPNSKEVPELTAS